MTLIHKFKQGDKCFVLDINSGTVHIVDELVYNMLNEECFEDMEALKNRLCPKYSEDELQEAYDEIQTLINEKSLYSEDIYKSNIDKITAKSPSYIKALCLNIAHDCNLKCKYCFAEEGEYGGERKLMTPEIGKKAIDFVIEKSGPRKNIEVDLFGGEPLLAFDAIKEIVKYARIREKEYGKNIRFTMTTNCVLLNDEIIDYIDKNMGNIVLSIDGRKEVNDKVRVRKDGSGSYDTILPKIKKMVQKRDKAKQYYVRATFTRNNIDFFNDVIHLADLGFKEISIEPVVLPKDNPLSIREEDLPEIFRQYDLLYKEMLKRNREGRGFKFYHFNIDLNGGPCIYKRISGCGSGHEYVAITPEGDIYPCHQFVGNQKFKMGNLSDGKLNTDIAEKFKNGHIYNKPICMECWARFYCSGGCQANNYNFNESIKIPYEIGCKMQKKRIECAIALKADN